MREPSESSCSIEREGAGRTMRLTIVVLALAGLWMVQTAAATPNYEIVPRFGLPLPGGDVGASELGISAGVTATGMTHRYLNGGVDVVYQYWPASAAFKTAFDRRMWLLVIDEPDWAFSTLQITSHVKASVPLRGWLAPWIRVGAGIYRVDPNLELFGHRLDAVYNPGSFGSVGVDFMTGARAGVGLHATYHHVWAEDSFGEDFTAFTAGLHLLFVRAWGERVASD
jgi:hypothetical protein